MQGGRAPREDNRDQGQYKNPQSASNDAERRERTSCTKNQN
jgi:hypothetical protein